MIIALVFAALIVYTYRDYAEHFMHLAGDVGDAMPVLQVGKERNREVK